ncbi:MAG: TetR/AcrR family transcriptional regulator, partial [Acidobacteria bacterium]|nr:TetR/AcrR family transcriptional regulator [Acidobacteriota bacterium]
MLKGERTREWIVEQAAVLFNQKGFSGCSLSQLMDATGLKKGGIYNHFTNKDQLALEAFDYAVGRVEALLRDHLASAQDERERLLRIVDFYRAYPEDPIIAGGCPLLNTIIDSDDAHPELRERAQIVMKRWIHQLAELIRRGQRKGVFDPSVDAEGLALLALAMIEGGIALA